VSDLGPFIVDGATKPVEFVGVWDGEEYERAVRHWYREIRKWRTGRLVLSLWPAGATVTIRPESTVATLDAHFNPDANAIEFTPGKRVEDSGHFVAASPRVGLRPDETLLHEVWHAMRYHRGFDRGPDDHAVPTVRLLSLPALPGVGGFLEELEFDRLSEIFAITVVNIYISEKHHGLSYRPLARPGTYQLRADHRDWRPLRAPDQLHQSARIRQAFRTFLWQQPWLFHQLVKIPTEFNPLRDFLRLEAEEKAAARRASARRRKRVARGGRPINRTTVSLG
jgi:hypothetical protein